MNTQQKTNYNNIIERTDENIIPIFISDNVLQQIKYLCNKISQVEWSGILFYSTEGDITNPKKFKINIEYILPMDKGSSAYTEYNLDNRYIDFLMDNPEAMDWKIGHIHSHNNMNVYFSKTDTEELYDNAPNHNYYLSLIVNNLMEMTAKIAHYYTLDNNVEIKYKANNSDGKSFNTKFKKVIKDSGLLNIFNCNITQEQELISVSDDFINQVENIIKVEETTNNKISNYNMWGDYYNNNWKPSKQSTKQLSLFDNNIYNSRELDDIEQITCLYLMDATINEINNADELGIDDYDTIVINYVSFKNPIQKFNHLYYSYFNKYGSYNKVLTDLLKELDMLAYDNVDILSTLNKLHTHLENITNNNNNNGRIRK